MGVRITSIVPGKSEFPACDTVENRCPDSGTAARAVLVFRQIT